jgi:nitroreductase
VSRAPQFGDPLPVTPAPEVAAFLARRRSASAQALTAPGPDAETLIRLLTLAVRVPDHGKLSPWRFVVIDAERKPAFVERVERLAAERPDPEKAMGSLIKLRRPPVSVVVVSSTTPGHKIPVWEQELSAGSVCMSLLLAAQAEGFGANWITDWYSEDPRVLALLGVAAGERVAGFIHLGTAAEAPLERVRPDVRALTTLWDPTSAFVAG